MAFLNAMGAVSRHGQWRLRRVLRSSLPDGRLDLSDAGLFDLSAAHRRGASGRAPAVAPALPDDVLWRRPFPVLVAAATAGTLVVSNPGIVEALFRSDGRPVFRPASTTYVSW